MAVVTELTIDARGSEQGQAQYVRAMSNAQAAMERTMAVNARLWESNDKNARATQQVAAANDNLSRSYSAVNDNVQRASKSFVEIGSEVLKTAGHLKFAAVAAYALSPAFRAMVNPAVVATISALGPAAVSAGAAVISAFSPALAFLGRIAIPILLVVAAWKALNAVISTGSDLLEKYGGTAGQRALFKGAEVDAKLADLTRLQGVTVSAQQIQYATQLGSRIEEAKRQISEFLKVQLDLTNPALRLQNAWVVIVEMIAKALTLAGQIPQAFGQAANAIGQSSIWDRLPKVSAAQESAIIARIEANNGRVAEIAETAEEAFDLAKNRLAAAMGGGFVGRFAGILDEKRETDAWTRFTDQVTKANAAVKANTETMGLGVRAHEQMKIQLQGEAVLERDGVKDTKARRKELEELAAAAGDVALAMEKAKIANDLKFQTQALTLGVSDADLRIAEKLKGLYPDIAEAIKSAEAEQYRFLVGMREMQRADFDQQTLGLSDVEKHIAQVNYQLHGNKWSEFMNDGLSATLRLTAQTKLLQDVFSDAFKGFRADVQSGIEPLKALENQLVRISDRIVNLGLDNLIKSQLAGLMGGGRGDLTSSLRGAFAAARQDANAEYRASYGDFSQRYTPPGQAGLAGSAGGYAIGGLAAVGSGIGAYRGGQATGSPGQGALGGALAGGLSGAAIGSMFLPVIGTAIGAGVGAVAGGILGFFGGQSGQKQQQLEQWKQNQSTIQGLQVDTKLAGLDTSTRSGAFTALALGQNQQRNALIESSKGDYAVLAAAEETYMAQRAALHKQFDDRELAEKEQHLKDLAALRQSYDDRYFAATTDTTTLQGAMLAFDRRAAQERLQVEKDFAEALPDLDRTLAAEKLQIQNDFAKKSVEAEQQAADQRMAAINGAAKSIVDYLNGLMGGAGSTLAPRDQLTNAQSVYNANTALALGGNIDAQNKFPQLADAFEKASRAVNASSLAYQADRQQIISQGLALPAVQQTTDPVTVALRDVLGAINAGNATQALDATLNNVILAALNAGNAAAIATLLVPKFDTLNTTADAGLDYDEFLRGLGPAGAALATGVNVGNLLTDTQLRAAGIDVHGPLTDAQIRALGLTLEQGNALNIFRELDANGDGQIDKLELIRGSVSATRLATEGTENAANAIRQIEQAARLAVEGTENASIAGNLLLVAIKGLQDTSARQLDLLNNQFAAGGGTNFVTGSALINWGTVTVPISGATVNNNMITALNKIVINTWAIADNTEFLSHNIAASQSTISHAGKLGVFASGGIIPPFGLGLVSEHSPGGGRFIRAGSEPITVTPFAPTNDNSAAVVAELRALRQEVARLQVMVSASGKQVTRAIVEKGDEQIDAIDENGRRVAYASTQVAKDNKAA